MSLYDPNGNKQKPIARDGRAFYSHATCPAAQEIVKRPSYVLINNPGNFSFAYSSGSYPSNYITGSIITQNGGGPVRLDISPIAWGGDGTATGDVTFVYVRVS